jgi:hypothetical protein
MILDVKGLSIVSFSSFNIADTQNELRLTFKFKLHVMDRNGQHAYLHVWKEQAEEFFGKKLLVILFNLNIFCYLLQIPKIVVSSLKYFNY